MAIESGAQKEVFGVGMAACFMRLKIVEMRGHAIELVTREDTDPGAS